MSLSIPKKKPLNKPVSPVVKLDGKESNVNGGCKPPALATGTRSEGACSSRTGPFAIDICMLSIRSTPAHAFAITANSPSPHLSCPSSRHFSLPDVAFTCRRQLHSLKN